jgi:hypothetical protein
MKTITKNKLSLYIFEEDRKLNINETLITVGDPAEFIIGDCNSNNSMLHENVIPPEDWKACKYFYDSEVWTLNPKWLDTSDVNIQNL